MVAEPKARVSLRIKLRRIGRRIRKFLRRGVGYRLGRFFGWLALVFYAFAFIYLAIFEAEVAQFRLDWNTFVSIVLADIPVGIVLWLVLERRESENRKILDSIDIVEAPKRFSHLEIHYADEWDDAEYPHKDYFVVNNKKSPKTAYRVSEALQDLVEAKIVRKHDKYADRGEMLRYFVANKIELDPREPTGDDLAP